MPEIVFCEQLDENGVPTAEWLSARCGRITASRMCDLMAYSKAKGKEGQELKARADYRDELLAERLSGSMSQHFVTAEMKRGIAEEGYARASYEMRENVMVEQIGFAIHSDLKFCGASPDGILPEQRKIIEIKNLTTVNHIALWRSRQVPSDYYDQMQWTMFCMDYECGDFVSCDSRLAERNPHLELLIIPAARNPVRIAELEAEAVKMNAELEAMMELLSPQAVQTL